MKINIKISMYSLYLKTIKRQEAEIQGLLHPAQANFGYFLALFHSLQLPSTQTESPLALISLAPKSKVSNMYSTVDGIFHFSSCDMTPERRKCLVRKSQQRHLLLDNGWLKHISAVKNTRVKINSLSGDCDMFRGNRE
jgi:hypothetical protein